MEDWIRGRGDNPAGQGVPSPSSLVGPLPSDAGPIDRLLHGKAQISSLDYDVNTDWWNASLGIGFGVSAGSLNGASAVQSNRRSPFEERTQPFRHRLRGAPGGDLAGSGKPFTNCSDTEPITT
ncbi:hypothetical protein [Streptomyces sp. DHE17-7]|uniref:hypothetical protein n=1 Tax=Streptomyces sp. DHE17-7 TaxID=2759949 RepID=UPI0022EAB2C6|nr:hypothetical protein [Streptomyces sp. DHE17-7]MBJ6618127.1 hypothetical protein [Streptomyces sp. DHE17-7]